MSVNQDRVQLWVDALEFGDLAQTKHILCELDLHGIPIGYCCLGVATEVALENGLVANEDVWDGAHLHPVVVQWYGLDAHNPLLNEPGETALPAATWNDDEDATFPAIAAMVRAKYLKDQDS